MLKFKEKMLKLRMTKWRNLTLGEKILKAVTKLIKIALIVAIGYFVVNVVLGIVIAGYVAFAIAGAVADGFGIAANAYRPGDCYVHFR